LAFLHTHYIHQSFPIYLRFAVAYILTRHIEPAVLLFGALVGKTDEVVLDAFVDFGGADEYLIG
jgi:hypothetical protein